MPRLMCCARVRLHTAAVIFAYLALAGAGGGRAAAEEPQNPRKSPPVVVEGESLRAEGDVLRAEGAARARSPQGELRADFIEFDRARGRLRAEGAVSARAGGFHADADFLEYENGAGELRDFEIRQIDGGVRVRGERATLREGDQLRARAAVATSCPASDEDWKIAADEIFADWSDNQARAYGARFYLSGTPVFYLPYARFVVDSRRKRGGVLPPIIGSRGGDFDVSLPIYFYFAEDSDATVAPRWIGGRGWLLENELRWLRPRGRGALRVDGFAGADRRRGKRRGRWDFDGEYQSGAWTARAEAVGVSDGEYYRDISRDGDDLTRRNLPHRVEFEYRPGDEWRFGGEAARYRTIGEVERAPADVLPRAFAAYDRVFVDGRIESRGEFARFAADSARSSIEIESLDFDRFAWESRAEIDRRFGAWRLTPAIGVKAARYRSRGAGAAAPAPGSGYATPRAAIEGERLWSGGRSPGGGYDVRNRLRLFYAFAPRSDQGDLPLLDSAARDGGAAALFDWDRFVGGDRAADANFASFGFGGDFSRRVDSENPPFFSSWSYFVAQRYHFRAPRVTLAGETAPQAGFSGMHLSARARDEATEIRADLEWDAELAALERADLRLRRDISPRSRARAAYRQYEGDAAETERIADAAFEWREGGRRWTIDAAYSISDRALRNGRLRATLPDDCGCWNLEFEVERVFESESESSVSWSLRFTLDGF